MGCKKIIKRLEKAENIMTVEHAIVTNLIKIREDSDGMSNLDAAFEQLKNHQVKVEKFLSQI